MIESDKMRMSDSLTALQLVYINRTDSTLAIVVESNDLDGVGLIVSDIDSRSDGCVLSSRHGMDPEFEVLDRRRCRIGATHCIIIMIGIGRK